MRSILTHLVFTCLPAFGQESTNPAPDNAAPGFSAGARPELRDALRNLLHYAFRPQSLQTSRNAPALPRLRTMAASPADSVCSIPLLNVKPRADPAPMPNMIPKTSQGLAPIDNMSIAVPAPACPADFGKVSGPHTAP